MTHLVSNQVKGRSCGASIKYNHTALDYTDGIHPSTAPARQSCQAGHYCSLKNSQVDNVDNYFPLGQYHLDFFHVL